MVKQGVDEMPKVVRLQDKNTIEENAPMMAKLEEDKIKKAILRKRFEDPISVLKLSF